MSADTQKGNTYAAVLATIAVGAVAIYAGLSTTRPPQEPAVVAETQATAEYGRRLLRDTALYIGPDHEDPDMRYSGTRMACASCHLDQGFWPILGQRHHSRAEPGREQHHGEGTVAHRSFNRCRAAASGGGRSSWTRCFSEDRSG